MMLMETVGNEEVRRRVSVRNMKSNRVNRMISKLFKHVDRVGDQRLTRSERLSQEGVECEVDETVGSKG